MSGAAATAATALALAVLVLAPARGGRLDRRSRGGEPLPTVPTAEPWLRRASARRGAGVLAGASVALLVGGGGGLVAGLAVATVAVVVLGRLVRRPLTPVDDGAVARDAAVAADLLASVVEAGVGVRVAVAEVAAALPGPIGSALRQVHRLDAVGAPPGQALADLEVPAGRLARALQRALHTGMPPVPVLRAAAAMQRDRARSSALRRARGAGSRAALPVGLCFLPAFVLVSVVPVVVAGLGQVVGR